MYYIMVLKALESSDKTSKSKSGETGGEALTANHTSGTMSDVGSDENQQCSDAHPSHHGDSTNVKVQQLKSKNVYAENQPKSQSCVVL
mgnify:CR=1 FL=1